MERKAMPRILIGATGSGNGKTTLVCGILQALKNRGLKPIAFKCGPDYIDPMFHREAMGLPSSNLDLFFMGEGMARHSLLENAEQQKAELAIIEGVMGYYDGLAGVAYTASSYHVAMATETPAVLLVDCKGKSLSVLAEIKGFLELEDDSNIQGVILNRISPVLYQQTKELIEERLGIFVYGYLPVMEECSLESRHLGLVTAQEVGNLQEILQTLAGQCEKTLDLDSLLRLAASAPPVEDLLFLETSNPRSPRIAVARDKAFCFYYEDNLRLLEKLGCRIVAFSPLEDRTLPEQIDGLYLGGGYPELYLPQLSGNETMRESIKQAVKSGLPTIAECGGFMYLQQAITDREGNRFPMAGALTGESRYTGKLVRFGYVELKAGTDNLLCEVGQRIRGHEFHYWDSTENGEDYRAYKPLRNSNWPCVQAGASFYAGFPHLHFYSNLQAARRFVTACAQWGECHES